MIEVFSRTLVLILGMHRSGTSYISKLVSKLGLPFGDRLMPPGRDNPEGFFEDLDVVALNDRILSDCGCSWSSLKEPDYNELIRGMSESYQHAMNLLQDRFDRFGPVFALKDPRMCRLLPFWRAAIINSNIRTKCIVVVRHPHSIATSLFKRDGFDLEKSVTLWHSYMLSCSCEMHPSWDRMIVDYDSALDYPRRENARIAGFIGFKDPIEGAIEAPRVDLRHSLFRGTDHLSPADRSLWRVLYSGANIETGERLTGE